METVDRPMTKPYAVEARRVGGWWAIDVPKVRGGHTQVRRLQQAETAAREAIALLLEGDPAAIEVKLQVVLAPQTQETLDEVRRVRAAAAEAERDAAAVTRQAVGRLLASGLSMRDAGTLLGLSHQRVAQLARSEG